MNVEPEKADECASDQRADDGDVELSWGIQETQITFRFWVIGAIGGILGIVTFLATRGVGA